MTDTTVTVTDDGKITVNGVLCAEIGAGKVERRDDLASDIVLHRIAGVLADQLRELPLYFDSDSDSDPTDRARGLVDGILGVTSPHPSPGVPPIQGGLEGRNREYIQGWQAGNFIVQLGTLIDREIEDRK